MVHQITHWTRGSVGNRDLRTPCRFHLPLYLWGGFYLLSLLDAGQTLYPTQNTSKALWSTHTSTKTRPLKLCVGKEHLLLKQKMYLGNKHKEQFTPLHWNEGYISRYLQGKKKNAKKPCRSWDFSITLSYLANKTHLITSPNKKVIYCGGI